MVQGGEPSNAFAASLKALIASLRHPLSLLSQLSFTDQEPDAEAETLQSDQSAHHFRSPVTLPAGAERGRASTFSVLTRKSLMPVPLQAGERQNLYTDHVDANVSCHCLQGLERQGVNISDNALVRHNLVVFRNGDSAMQVSEASICLVALLACSLASPVLSSHPTGLNHVVSGRHQVLQHTQASGGPRRADCLGEQLHQGQQAVPVSSAAVSPLPHSCSPVLQHMPSLPAQHGALPVAGAAECPM